MGSTRSTEGPDPDRPIGGSHPNRTHFAKNFAESSRTSPTRPASSGASSSSRSTAAGWVDADDVYLEPHVWQLRKDLVRSPAYLRITPRSTRAVDLKFDHYGPGC